MTDLGVDSESPVARVARQHGAHGDDVPASHGQRLLWLVGRLAPDSPVYHYTMFLRMEGPLRTDVLRTAVETLVARHESLRTTLHNRDGRLVQHVHHDVTVHLPVHSAPDWDAAHDTAVRASRRPMDLATGPLLRTELVRIDATRHLFACVVHHAVFDGWSEEVWWRELAAVYDAVLSDSPPDLPALPVQHGDVAAWQNARLAGPEGELLLDYWRTELAGARPLALPTDRRRPPVPAFRGATHAFTVPRSTVARLQEFCREEHITLYIALLAATAEVLRRWTDQDDVPVTVTTADRPLPEAEHVIGYLAGGLVLRTRLAADRTFRELTGEILETFLDGMEHQGMPPDVLAARTRPRWERAGNPFGRVAVTLDPVLPPMTGFAGLRVRQTGSFLGVAKWDLGAVFRSGEGELLGHLTYDSALFDSGTIVRMADALVRLLDEVAKAPDRRVRDIDLLNDEERRGVFGEPYDPTVPSHELVRLFEEQVTGTPNAPAVHAGRETVTYRDLARRVAALAARLRAHGVRTGTAVALCLPRSVTAVVAVLAVLRAGGACVPLDPSWPAERRERATHQCGADILLTLDAPEPPPPATAFPLTPGAAAPSPAGEVSELCLERIGDSATASAWATPGGGGGGLACVLPGDTADGSGPVALTHTSFARLADSTCYGDLGPGTVHLQLAPPASGHALATLLSPLLNGGAVAVPPGAAETMSVTAEVRAALAACPVTTALFTAAQLRLVADDDPASLSAFRETVVDARELTPAVVARALVHRRGRPLRIVHGPVAGCAGAALSALVHDIDVARCGVPVGRPVAGSRAYVLDRDLRPVPTGVPGELWLGGEGLGHGGPDPDSPIADRCVPDPFSPRPGAVMYRTGDLARLLPDGGVEYLGRTADRVEIAGMRTETAVLRAAITSHPGIADAYVAARDDLPDGAGLVAYVVPAAGTAPDAAALRELAATTLPRYLVPDVVVPLPALPSADGRVDRSALASAAAADGPAAETTGAPVPDGLSTATERAVADEWRAVIGLSPPDREAKFLEAGGDSVLLVLFAERLRERFAGRAPAVVELFEYATVAQIAALVDSRAVSDPGEAG
ncbi:condensation domain-containing protein [Streptomyces sp. NPDC050704]|uniref:condensation domain-containing protein n=1 Tax=Streptomyces sp. NPDC050704 TaxID=3157219 RepID=UPI00342E07D7